MIYLLHEGLFSRKSSLPVRFTEYYYLMNILEFLIKYSNLCHIYKIFFKLNHMKQQKKKITSLGGSKITSYVYIRIIFTSIMKPAKDQESIYIELKLYELVARSY